MKSDDFKEKKEKYLEENNVKNAFQIKENQEKQKETVKEKYGVDNVFQNEEVKEKIKDYYQKNYGVDHVMKVPEFKEKCIEHKNASIKERNNTPVSANQIKLNEVYGGEMNHLFKYYFVDLYFPEDNIYIEYDGSGHKFPVLLGKMTEEEFNQKETIRYHFLKNNYNLKMMRIIHTSKKLPEDDFLIKIKEKGFNFLREKENNWIIFDLDNLKVRTKFFEKDIKDFL